MDLTKADENPRAPALAPVTAVAESGESGSQQIAATDPELVADAIEADGRFASARSLRDAIALIPGARALIVATAVRCLGAQRMMGKGKSEVMTVDDGSTQMKAVVFLASYLDGLPVQQNLNINFDANKEMPVKEMLLKSPALLAAVEKMVAEVKAVQKPGGAKAGGA